MNRRREPAKPDVKAAPPTQPERSRDGCPPPPVSLERIARRFTERLRCVFAAEIARDVRGFKKRVIQQLKRNLPPGPGRTPLEATTKAIQLRELGGLWPDVYRACIPGYDTLSKAERHMAANNLRAARRSRLNLRKRRKSLRRPLPAARPENR
jgi:hypothetical protein